MSAILLRLYDRFILKRPIVTLVVTLAAIGFFTQYIPEFKLDASGDSLLLENDADLHYNRRVTERYGTREVLVLTYSPKGDLFSAPTLADLKQLRDELRQLAGVSSVITILDIPLLLSTNISLRDLGDVEKIKTLEKSAVDKRTILREVEENPLYLGRMLSHDQKTTVLLINLPVDIDGRSLLQRRYELREKKYNHQLTAVEAMQLTEVSEQYRQHLTTQRNQESHLVAEVRSIMESHRGMADLYLGGVPMIVADMITFIENDLVIFGIGVSIFLIITLTIIFRKLRWVLLSMSCCLLAVLTMVGYLGMVDWRVTVVSSNFISLMLILTMALTIHLIERYLEVHAQSPDADQKTLVLETVRTIARPCLYTALTTIVAFVSLLVSGIRPIMDFGMMMTIGVIVSFILAFLIFPPAVVLIKKDASKAGEDFSHPYTLTFARLTQAHGVKILWFSIILAVISGIGITKLKVENRFIDYFRQKTDIYQGLSLIDRKLGGTTPLDLIIDFHEDTDEINDSAYHDEFFAEEETGDDVYYWFANVVTMEQIERIHDFLEGLPETGEVLSLATGGKLATRLNDNVPLDGFDLSLMVKKSPPDIKELLIYPYVSEDIPQTRFTMRIMESGKGMERNALLEKIRKFLKNEIGYTDEQIHFSNMFVLYNNMLRSLFRSQILTIGLVFLAIMVMFTLLFRSFYLAVIAIIPNLLPAALVLGTMGWFGIPLDMMTITIASITIGIAVDDTIHYIHRFQREFRVDRNYLATVYRCHRSIGRAMYYTSVTIMIGFSILVLSNFIPTIYFGMFTCLAMLVAMLAALTLLPQLLITLKPLGPEKAVSRPMRKV